MNRRGFSLIEVIIATAILMGSVFVLSELAGLGRRQSQRAETETRAQELCAQTLAEIALGERPLEEVQDAPLLPPDLTSETQPDVDDADSDQLLVFEDPDAQLLRLAGDGDTAAWTYSVSIRPVPDFPALGAVTVSVAKSGDRTPLRFSLTRWIELPESMLSESTSSIGGGFR